MGNGLIVEEGDAASEAIREYMHSAANPECRRLRERGDVSGYLHLLDLYLGHGVPQNSRDMRRILGNTHRRP